MKILPAFFLLFLLISLSSCHDDEHYDIKIKNTSDKAIAYAVAMARAQDKYALVGDLVPRANSVDYRPFRGSLEDCLRGRNPMITIYFVDPDSISNVPCSLDSIAFYNKVLKQCDVTLGLLIESNWTITYP